eukprot:g27673.t1
MFKFTSLVVSGPKRQYMVEIVHPQRWQDFLTEFNRKLDWSMENATLVMGKMDSLPRAVALPKVTVGGVECAVPKWAWFLSAAGKKYLKRKETHLRLGKILRQLATDTCVRPGYFRYFYSYYSVCTDQVEVSSCAPEYLFGFLPDAAAQAIESKHNHYGDTYPQNKLRFAICLLTSNLQVKAKCFLMTQTQRKYTIPTFLRQSVSFVQM